MDAISLVLSILFFCILPTLLGVLTGLTVWVSVWDCKFFGPVWVSVWVLKNR